jgi:hypothetical protein
VSVNQISDSLGLRKIDLAIQKRAFGEFARLGHSSAKLEAPSEHKLHDARTAMTLQFNDVLPGVGTWASKVQADPGIENAACGIQEFGERS